MFLIAVIRDGQVEIQTVMALPEKCLILHVWQEHENV